MLRRLLHKLKLKPVPRNLYAFKRCKVSYSQFGEDLFLSTLLGPGRTTGVYVDVGCYDPVDFSNTYLFYERGWHGVAVDPNPAFAPAWRRYRPRDRFVNCAVAESTGTRDYWFHPQYPTHNQLLVPGAPRPAGGRILPVPARPLRDVLAEQLGDQPLDLLNVDCEGMDVRVLETHDFTRWPPKVVAAEDAAVHENTPLVQFLSARGYTCRSHIGLTKIFQREPAGL